MSKNLPKTGRKGNPSGSTAITTVKKPLRNNKNFFNKESLLHLGDTPDLPKGAIGINIETGEVIYPSDFQPESPQGTSYTWDFERFVVVTRILKGLFQKV